MVSKLRLASLCSLIGEVGIILFFLFLNNNFFRHEKITINSDGRGYYEYLPALFIYNDIHFSYLDTLHSEGYDFSIMKDSFYPRLPNNKRFDKYFIGTSLLQSPFFAIGHTYAQFSENFKADGFSPPYQIAIYAASLCYLFFGLVFLRLLFLKIDLSRWWIFLLQVGVFYCGSLMLYTHINAAYSHVYSFFSISAWLFFTYSFFKEQKSRFLFFSLFFFGLIVLIRPINLLVLLFLPLISKTTSFKLKKIISTALLHKKALFFGITSLILLSQIQCIIWFAQTGNWICYAYQEEGFNFLDPHSVDFLFSYQKGFFLWAPWFFVLLVFSTIRLLFLKGGNLLLFFWAPFLILIYILSSWHDWGYGMSLGMRPMIDYYPILLFFAAISFKNLKLPYLIPHSTALAFLAYLMIVQTYQYQCYILHWDRMNRNRYWQVFLKTDKKYEGIFWH